MRFNRRDGGSHYYLNVTGAYRVRTGVTVSKMFNAHIVHKQGMRLTCTKLTDLGTGVKVVWEERRDRFGTVWHIRWEFSVSTVSLPMNRTLLGQSESRPYK